MTRSNAPETAPHPALAPVRLGGLRLPNRLAVAPMTRVSATPEGVPTPDMADYYAGFARGGFGLVITEGTYTDAVFSQGYLDQPGLVSPAHVEGWRAVTDAVHAEGALMVAQLMHAGAISQGSNYRSDTAGPSALRPRGVQMPEYGGRGPWAVPREMTGEDIAQAIGGFAAAAENARAAGFDGVELHAANGYLLDQFLTDYTNLRTDEYGGSLEGRVRLVAEVLAAVRAAVGPEFAVGVRVSQTKVNDFEYRWPGGAEDAKLIFTRLAEAGATYIHVASEGRDWIETARLDGGQTITALAREISGLPVIANGNMHNVGQGARVIAEGHADLLSLGRGALANPDFPRRLADGVGLEAFDPGMLHPMACLRNARQWADSRETAESSVTPSA
ncbi:NADH:flavin oxidoreductase [Streptosporangium sp. NPDC051023]|uniref:NADH:flavin oxidoreductase n=1 Tax=Streptosporangium sp. NPDC051023 TaxID=3155410 RepID=UPI00344B6EFF